MHLANVSPEVALLRAGGRTAAVPAVEGLQRLVGAVVLLELRQVVEGLVAVGVGAAEAAATATVADAIFSR